MSLFFAYTPPVWLPVITVLLLTVPAVYSFRRHSVPGALPLPFALLFGLLWMVGISLEVAAVDASTRIFWVKYQTAWLLPSAAGIACFLLEYAWPGRWLTRRKTGSIFRSLLAYNWTDPDQRLLLPDLVGIQV